MKIAEVRRNNPWMYPCNGILRLFPSLFLFTVWILTLLPFFFFFSSRIKRLRHMKTEGVRRNNYSL